MNKSKAKIVVNSFISIIQIVAGAFLAVMFGLCFLVTLFDLQEMGIAVLIVFIILTLCEVWLIRVGCKRRKLGKNFKIYVSAISNGSGSIPEIAQSVGVSEDVVRDNLNRMIKKRFFVNAYIDASTNCIIVGNRGNVNMEKTSSQSVQSDAASYSTHEVENENLARKVNAAEKYITNHGPWAQPPAQLVV